MRVLTRILAAPLGRACDEIARIQHAAGGDNVTERPRWPMIVLRSPKGRTWRKTVDGLPAEGSFRSHPASSSPVG